jgi:hypothetical protein
MSCKKIMPSEKAERLIRDRFWNFHSKLVEDFPRYKLRFDHIVSESQDRGVLWEVLEFAQYHLEADIEIHGFENISTSHYSAALEYGYLEWVN